MKLSDHEVIEAIILGGTRVHKIMDYVYLKSRKKIIGYVVKNGGSREDGQDVLQDAVSSFYTNIINNKFRGESDIEGYLFGIARNTWRKILNARSKEKAIKNEGMKEEEEISQGMDEAVLRKLDVVLEKMNLGCREILIHAFYYNYSAAELSKKFEFKNEQVARNKKYKCLRKLREMMAKIKIR